MFRLKEFVCRMMVQRKRKTTLYYSRQMWFNLIEIIWKIWFIYHMLANHNHVVMMLNWNWEPKTWHSDFNLYVILYYVLCKQYSTGMLFCFIYISISSSYLFYFAKNWNRQEKERYAHATYYYLTDDYCLPLWRELIIKKEARQRWKVQM